MPQTIEDLSRITIKEDPFRKRVVVTLYTPEPHTFVVDELRMHFRVPKEIEKRAVAEGEVIDFMTKTEAIADLVRTKNTGWSRLLVDVIG